ncbi:hypothetical protein G1K75_12860 [Tenacibaculum finnmarkense]|uniref:hypothetical protein n=1 Tax=Tenacibaculum TaxID=104267 RepID=UPI001EFE3F14|nr:MULTISPECIES: hypothetical protein [Tenacibaculum]MCG8806539.1 hypothetical protein [Tenacibaculum finnmarkense]MCG8857690.1 hypothetical protein [Tenacibaculum finnmarkense]
MKKSSRYIISIICLTVIILRLIFPKLNFDLISLSLLAIATLAIIINKPEKILEKTKKIKLGSFELELKELNKKTEQIEEITTVEKEEPIGLSGPIISREKTDFEISTDFLTDILKLSIEIEKTLREIYESHFQTSKKSPLSVIKLIEKLKSEEVINQETSNLLRKFWNLRNQAIHDHNFQIDRKDFMSFTDIGIRILKILKTMKNNKSDELPIYGMA